MMLDPDTSHKFHIKFENESIKMDLDLYLPWLFPGSHLFASLVTVGEEVGSMSRVLVKIIAPVTA